MRVLYVASDVPLSAPHGGSVHVREVAAGLAARGNAVRVIVRRQRGEPARGTEAGFEVRRTLGRVPYRPLRLFALPTVASEIRSFDPDVILERYYNFGGEGLVAGSRRGIPVVLEVNSPMVEYVGSPKERIDRWLGSPMRRWRTWMASRAAGFVTPSSNILPSDVPEERVHLLPWGANTDRFVVEGTRAEIPEAGGRPVVVFVGSFRAWHGAHVLVDAASRLARQGQEPPLFLMIGDGPCRTTVENRVAAAGLRDSFRFVGALPYEQIPSCLRAARVGLAPFETSRHRYLEIDFYWCPLKILEYMACGLPVVTIDVAALRRIVRPGVDGLLYREGDIDALASAIADLIANPERARAMGESARKRAVGEFSWHRHCERLEAVLRSVADRRDRGKL